MTAGKSDNLILCPREEIFSYLDGELSSACELRFERHLADCRICSEEVNTQKKVSNSLEIILEEDMQNFLLPENFTEIVKARAEGHVSGLRHRNEISLAVGICAILFATVTYGFGAANDSILLTFQKFADQVFAVVGYAAYLVYETAAGISVILRSLCHKFLFSSMVYVLLIFTSFVIAFWSLSRLVFRKSRS